MVADNNDTTAVTEEGSAQEGEIAVGGEAPAGGGRKKILIIVLVALILLIVGAGAALYFFGFLDRLLGKEVAAVETSVEVDGAADPAAMAEGGAGSVAGGVANRQVYYDLEEFIVNLNVGGKRPSFLKMTVSLELAGELQIPEVEAKLPRIRDSFQVYLRELRADDLQGSAGIYRLREELLLRINKVIYPVKVHDILFKEILVQ
jgi:flagellar FliL protein